MTRLAPVSCPGLEGDRCHALSPGQSAPNYLNQGPDTRDQEVEKRTCVSTQVNSSFRLSLTLVELSRRNLFTVWPLNTSRQKLMASHLDILKTEDFLWLAWTCERNCESVSPPIASPYASSGFVNWRGFSGLASVIPGLCHQDFVNRASASDCWVARESGNELESK